MSVRRGLGTYKSVKVRSDCSVVESKTRSVSSIRERNNGLPCRSALPSPSTSSDYRYGTTVLNKLNIPRLDPRDLKIARTASPLLLLAPLLLLISFLIQRNVDLPLLAVMQRKRKSQFEIQMKCHWLFGQKDRIEREAKGIVNSPPPDSTVWH